MGLSNSALQSISYNVENRVATVTAVNSSYESYRYSARNERLVVLRQGQFDEVYFHDLDGTPIEVYRVERGSTWTDWATWIFWSYPVRVPGKERIYFHGRLLAMATDAGGIDAVVTDRLGSVAKRGSQTYRYYPYGQEIGGATANDKPKFGTYTRDAISGLDYAMNRHYYSIWGRFTSPDPAQPANGTNPVSWNFYTYVEGDPINLFDPDGLTCRDLTFYGYSDIPNGITVGQVIEQRSDLSAFAQTLFTETRISADERAAQEKAAVAAVIMNRWQFVNGYYTLHAAPIGPRGSGGGVRVVPDWGQPDGSLTSIVFARGQFEPWVAPWALGSPSLSRLNTALDSADYSSDCMSLIQSIITAATYWSYRHEHHLYFDNGLIFTSFSAPARGRPATKSYYESWIGSYGSANQFAGVHPAQLGGPLPAPGAPRSAGRAGSNSGARAPAAGRERRW